MSFAPHAVDKLVIVSLPKSGTIFVSNAMRETLGCIVVDFQGSQPEIDREKFSEFLAHKRAVGGQHLLPTTANLTLLKESGIQKIAIMLRDPRDALVSWWHHLERPDIKSIPNLFQGLFEDGWISQDYDTLGRMEKLSVLVDRSFPQLQSWALDWLDTITRPSPFVFHVTHFEDFAVDPRSAIRDILFFFGHDIEPVLPSVEGERSGGIHAPTHFRRGKVGSYRDEAPPDLQAMLDRRIHPVLARIPPRPSLAWTSEAANEIPILVYHSVSDDGPPELRPWRLTPAAFEEQMRFLRGHGYHSISLDEWADCIGAGTPPPGRPVVITFDDGYKNFITRAAPLLEAADFRATVFVVTGKVGGVADWDTTSGPALELLSWDDLRSLEARGFQIGSHTAAHVDLAHLMHGAVIEDRRM